MSVWSLTVRAALSDAGEGFGPHHRRRHVYAAHQIDPGRPIRESLVARGGGAFFLKGAVYEGATRIL
eukprot:8545980-Pyramimonas_sp.AAC.1